MHISIYYLDVWNFLSAESFYFWDKLNHSFGRFRSTLFIFESNYFDDHKGLLIFKRVFRKLKTIYYRKYANHFDLKWQIRGSRLLNDATK